MSLTKNSKVILSCFEDKRYYINNLESYGYGHPKIPKNNINSSNNDDGDAYEKNFRRKRRKKKKTRSHSYQFPSKEKEIRYVYSRKNHYIRLFIYIQYICNFCVYICNFCVYMYVYKHIY